MALPETLSLSEKRELLEHVRIKFGFEATIPRETGIDKIVEKAMVASSEERPLSVSEVVEVLAGRELPLRFAEVQRAIGRLVGSGRARSVVKDGSSYYHLSAESARDIERELNEANARVHRIVARLYSGIPTQHSKLRKFLLRFLSDVFAQLSRQWVEIAVRRSQVENAIGQQEIRDLLPRAAKHAALEREARKAVFDRTMRFFRRDEPDYNMLKYILGQSSFIARLLALNIPFDDLSANLFSGGTLYLDTNVVITALLPGATRFNAFKELLSVCDKLGIKLLVLHPTYLETQRVVAYERTVVAPLYDKVPPELAEKTRGAFYQTYVTQKALDSSFTVEDVFRPFHDLTSTLKDAYQIALIDDPELDQMPAVESFRSVKRVLAQTSIEVRSRRKGEAALEHDAVVCLYLDRNKEADGKVRLLTLDRSLPPATSQLFKGEYSLAITLDGFLQSISPFVSVDRDTDFARVFAQLIESQVLPQDQIYDIRDYLVFQDMGMSCQTMPAEEVDEALHLMKTKVLRGDHYTHEDFQSASYEFRRFFTQRFARREELITEKQREIDELRGEHAREKEELRGESEQRIRQAEAKYQARLNHQNEELEALKSTLDALRAQIEARQLKRLRLLRAFKLAGICLWVTCGLIGVSYLALRYGGGEKPLERITAAWPLYGAVLAIAEAFVRALFPKHDPLRRFWKFVTRSWVQHFSVVP